jgi:ribosomal protein S20
MYKNTIEKSLAEKVAQMRTAQKKFFAAARKGQLTEKTLALELSKKLEKEVDEKVEEILHPKEDTRQLSLFNNTYNNLQTTHY